MTGEQKRGGLEAIISDEEIVRVHGHANFGPTMTPRDVVNEGVRKYAVGYTSGYTQLTILLEHGLITKPRPGRYEASLTKKGKRYARALGMYHATPAEPAEARIRELEARAREDDLKFRRLIDTAGQAEMRATAAEAKLARAVELVKKAKDLDVSLLHDGYDSGPGGGNYVYVDVVRTDELFPLLDQTLAALQQGNTDQ